MDADRQAYSRYQVLCADREAWNDGEADSEAYYYDGMSFWRRDAKGKERLAALVAHPGARLAPWRAVRLRPLHGAPPGPAAATLGGLRGRPGRTPSY